MHSGLQFGGEPIKSGRQVQDGASALTLHREFGPHGEGSQGLITTVGISAENYRCYIICGLHHLKLSYVIEDI